jgi:hypothetical protein
MINEVNAERGEKSQASPIGLIGRAVAKWLREKGDEQDKLCSDVWNRRVIDGFRLVHDVDRIQRDVGKDAPARMAYIPPPGNLPGISGAERVRPKTWVQVGSGRDGSTQMGTSMSGTFNTGALSVTIGEGTTPANSIILRGDK